MKTSIKYIAICLVLATLGTLVNAQEPGSLSKREQRLLLREEKRKENERFKEMMSQYVDSIVSDNRFVLEADMLFNKYGQSMQVQSTINFVLVDSLFGVFQVGDISQATGNGVGGVTYEGSVNNFKKEKDEKNGSWFVHYTLTTTKGTFDISLTVMPSGHTDASVRGNFGGSIRYSGELVGLREAKFYKGSSF